MTKTTYYGFSEDSSGRPRGEYPAWFHSRAAAECFAAAYSVWNSGIQDEIETTENPNPTDVKDTAEVPWAKSTVITQSVLPVDNAPERDSDWDPSDCPFCKMTGGELITEAEERRVVCKTYWCSNCNGMWESLFRFVEVSEASRSWPRHPNGKPLVP